MMAVSTLNRLKLLYGDIYVIDKWSKVVKATDKNLDRIHLIKNGIYAKLLDAKGNSICKSELHIYDIENYSSNIMIDNYEYGCVITVDGRGQEKETAILDKNGELRFRQLGGNCRNIGRIYEQNLGDINVAYNKKICSGIQYCKISVPAVQKRDTGIIYNGIDEYGVLVLDSEGIRYGIDNLRDDERLMYSLIDEKNPFRKYTVHRVANVCSVIKNGNEGGKNKIAISISEDTEIECVKSEKKSNYGAISKNAWFTKCKNVYKKIGNTLNTFEVNYVNIHCEVDMTNSAGSEVLMYHGNKNMFKEYSGTGYYEINILVDVNKNRVKIVDGSIIDESYYMRVMKDNETIVDSRDFEDVR